MFKKYLIFICLFFFFFSLPIHAFYEPTHDEIWSKHYHLSGTSDPTYEIFASSTDNIVHVVNNIYAGNENFTKDEVLHFSCGTKTFVNGDPGIWDIVLSRGEQSYITFDPPLMCFHEPLIVKSHSGSIASSTPLVFTISGYTTNHDNVHTYQRVITDNYASTTINVASSTPVDIDPLTYGAGLMIFLMTCVLVLKLFK